MATQLTAERLRELLNYDPETGVFALRRTRAGARPNQQPGHVEANGYRRIMIDGGRYLAHRLAWLHVHGEWPTTNLDHRNGERGDNRIENIRLATRSQNSANTRPKNPSGLKGAHYNRLRDCWKSSIKVRGKNRHLGNFGTAEEAHAAYMRAAREIHGDYVRGTL